MKKVGLKRGVVIVMNPQTGEVLALVSLPTYDNNQFARGISDTDYAKLAQQSRQAAAQPRDPGALPAGLDVQARGRHGRARGQEDHAEHEGPHARATSPSGRPGSTTGTIAGSGPCNIYCGFGHSSDTFFFQVAGMLGIDRLATGPSSTASAARPGSTCPARSPGSSRRTSGSRTRSARQIFPGETYQAGIGQGYDVVTPIQLINAYAALANGGTRLPAAGRARHRRTRRRRSSGRSSRRSSAR